MINKQEILEKAIQKAIDSGWNARFNDSGSLTVVTGRMNDCTFNLNHSMCLPYIIFNHDFAKALWGDKEYKPAEYVKRREYFTMPATGATVHEVNLDHIKYDLEPGGWQYHLQQMVIADDPLVYLSEHM